MRFICQEEFIFFLAIKISVYHPHLIK